jgi:hypothetical protein
MIIRTWTLVGSLVVFAFLSWVEDAGANMAVVNASEIQRTGNLVLRQKSTIQLDSERLEIRLSADTAVVSVNYDFFNHGGDEDVTIGFPVDLMPSPEDGISNIEQQRQDSLTGFQIHDSNDGVPIGMTFDEPLAPENRPRAIEGVSTKRRWWIATLRFKHGEHKYVSVDYTVHCIGVDSGFEGTMDGSDFTPRTFLYTLRPASSWGNGRAGKLDVTIDASFLRLNQFPILQVEPKPEADNGGVLRWSFDNLDLKTAPDFVCTYDPKPALFQKRAEWYLFKRFDNLRFKVSNGPDHNARTRPLVDRNPTTVWLGSGTRNGVGATFEFRPRKDSYVTQVAILNGCWESEKQYAAHARIKRLRIEYTLRLDGIHHERSEQVLPDRRFEERALRFPTYYADFLNLPGGPEGILEEIKLTPLELYPGADSKPLAISDLYVYGSDLHGR